MTLKERRMATGLNQKDFARKCGRTIKYVSAVENGRETPSPAMSEIIEKVLAGERVDRHMHGGRKVIPFNDAQEEAILRKIWLRDYT